MPYTSATVMEQPIARPSRPSVRLIALLKPTIHRKIIPNSATTPPAPANTHTGSLSNGTQNSRIFCALVGCQSSAASARTVITVCQRTFSPGEFVRLSPPP